MGAYEITKQHVKMWAVNNAHVNNPNKKSWTAAVTIGYDYYGEGDTIEKAYNNLVDQIFQTPSIIAQLQDVESFVKIVKQK